jgi:hypothetical protein
MYNIFMLRLTLPVRPRPRIDPEIAAIVGTRFRSPPAVRPSV